MSAPERIVVEHGANRIVHVWKWVGPATTTGIPPVWFRQDYIRADLASPISNETVDRLRTLCAELDAHGMRKHPRSRPTNCMDMCFDILAELEQTHGR